MYADQKRRDVSYSIGDLVYVKLRPYCQTSLTGHHYNKLAKQFYGPYRIVDKFGTAAYKLELPSTTKIHPVFHCSLLKLHKGPFTASVDPLPPLAIDNKPLVVPLAILDSKLDSSTDPPKQMVLVQWLGLAPEDTNWEDWQNLALTYHLEDKVLVIEGGNDNNVGPKNTGPDDNALGPFEETDGSIIAGPVGIRPKRNVSKPIYLGDYV